jgi:alpha-amylase
VFYGDLYPNHEYHEDTARDLGALLEVRKKHAYGALREYMHDYNRIGFVRLGDPEHKGCAVVLSNR